MIGRRALLRGAAAGGAAGLAGCGFHPLYAPSGATADTLQGIYVDIIPNRDGQRLREALQARLSGSDADVPKRYLLSVSASTREDLTNIQPDNSNTRIRRIVDATWRLSRAAPPNTPVAHGRARSVDGFNVIDSQFFYQTLEDEQAMRRQADAIADQITEQVAVWFRQHPGQV